MHHNITVLLRYTPMIASHVFIVYIMCPPLLVSSFGCAHCWECSCVQVLHGGIHGRPNLTTNRSTISTPNIITILLARHTEASITPLHPRK